ncbi:MAG: polyprenyl diphosphate synthase [candidate division SR1 bacterium]|nr:polyprenyl diphosphate synthase [candidate division SR1 bacterium]
MQYPKHVAIIPDGNRTRAKANDKTVAESYMISYEKAVELIIHTFTHTDVEVFTLRGLSTENAKKRPKEEFDFLMTMYKIVEEDLDEFMKEHKINFKAIGDLSGITEDFKDYLLAKEERNTYDTNRYFVFAINYGGRDEIVRGIQKLAKEKKDLTGVTEEDISKNLDLGGLPPIELVIRTKGDQAQRTSGFMSRWIGYAELYFTNKKCPEFDVEQYKKALTWFNEMADLRNYGK